MKRLPLALVCLMLVAPASQFDAQAPRTPPGSNHVVVISLDGFGGWALDDPYLPVPTAINNIAPGPVPIFRISPIERWRQIRSNRRVASQERSAVLIVLRG